MTCVLLRDGPESFFAVRDLLHPALAVQIFYGCVNFATGELLHSLFERRVLLAHDLVQVRGSHSGLLQLVVGPSGPDGFVLSHVAHKQNSVLFAESVQEVVNLPGTGETRFIEHVEMFFLGFGLRSTGKVVLQRTSLNSGLSRFLGSRRASNYRFRPASPRRKRAGATCYSRALRLPTFQRASETAIEPRN